MVLSFLFFAAAYVIIVLELGQILEHWWHVPRTYYLLAFLVPLCYILEWRRDRKAGK